MNLWTIMLLLIPYILLVSSLHWMLAVISPWAGVVFWLDPAGVENEPREFAKNVFTKYAIIKAICFFLC